MNKINKRFNELIGKLTDEQFWAYVKTWFDEQVILDIMNEWDEEIKEKAIIELEKGVNFNGN